MSCRVLMVGLGLWVSVSPAMAAEVTDMAPAMGGMVAVGYAGSSLQGGLSEAGVRISDRKILRHDLDLQLEVAPIEGVALTLDLAFTPSLTYSFPNAQDMIIEPRDGSGSYLFGEVSPETPTVRASGLRGVWVGAALAPFAERYARATASTWRLDVAYRTGNSGHNLWTAPDGKRGVSPGGSALKIIGAFSHRQGHGEPFLTMTYQRESSVTVDVVDEEGTTWAKGLELSPASTFNARGGVEVIASEDAEAHTRFAFDVFIGGGYRSWEDVASGVYLPNVVDGSKLIPVTVGDHLSATTGLGFSYHINEFARARSGMQFTYRTPFAPEHLYPVTTTADTWEIGWTVRVAGLGAVMTKQGPLE